MKSIDTLRDDIYALFENGGWQPSEENIKIFAEMLVKRITDKIAETRGPPTLRLSNLGKPCERQLWYQLNMPEAAEPLQPWVRIKFLYGDILEEMLLFLAREAKHTVENEQQEVDLHGVKGHIDATVDGVLLDCKSASTFGFAKFDNHLLDTDDPFGYRVQLDGYAKARGDKRQAFLAIDKQHGHITLDEYKPLDIDYNAFVERKKSVVSQKSPPPRGYIPEEMGKSGNLSLPVPCGYCSHRRTCFPESRTFLYANGPVHLLRVSKLPRRRDGSAIPELLADGTVNEHPK